MEAKIHDRQGFYGMKNLRRKFYDVSMEAKIHDSRPRMGPTVPAWMLRSVTMPGDHIFFSKKLKKPCER
jgi:hypothetical protein